MDLQDMIGELEEYYEAAGFENYYDNVLAGKSEEQIRKMYEDTFKQNDDIELENWERKHKGDME